MSISYKVNHDTLILSKTFFFLHLSTQLCH